MYRYFCVGFSHFECLLARKQSVASLPQKKDGCHFLRRERCRTMEITFLYWYEVRILYVHVLYYSNILQNNWYSHLYSNILQNNWYSHLYWLSLVKSCYESTFENLVLQLVDNGPWKIWVKPRNVWNKGTLVWGRHLGIMGSLREP
jgi:hypothetical protein